MARDYAAEYRSRDQRARERGFQSLRQQQRFSPRLRNRADYDALPVEAQEKYHRMLKATGFSRREGLDLEAAADRAGLTPAAFRYWAQGAISGGEVTSGDRLYRPMSIYSAGRRQSVDVRGSRVASQVGEYHNAVRRFLETGDERDLGRFTGMKVGGFELETDPDVLEVLGREGQFDFEQIYAVVT